jgi:hypothetical protein
MNMVTMPATPGQASLFFGAQRAVSDCAYNVPTVVEVRGQVSDTELLAACRRLVDRTPALRLRFGLDSRTGRVVQWISAEHPEIDFVEQTPDQAQPIADYAEYRALEAFEPDEGALCRLLAVRRGPWDAAIIVVTHHLIIDGVSHPELARRMGDAVADALAEQPDEQYAELVRHVLKVQAESRDRDHDHWAGRLPAGSRLPSWRSPATADFADREPAGVADGRRLVALGSTATRRTAADAEGVGLFCYLVAAIHRSMPVTGGDLSAVCAATSVRPRSGSHDAVTGCFINEVPMLADPATDGSIRELAVAGAPGWKGDLRRRTYPFVDLASRVARDGDAKALRMDSVIVSYRRSPRILTWRRNDLSFSADLYPRYPMAKNEISVRFFHRPDSLEYEVQWGRNLPIGHGEAFTADLASALADS